VKIKKDAKKIQPKPPKKIDRQKYITKMNMMANALQANNRPYSLRQPYIGMEYDPCDLNNQKRIGDRNYPGVVLYNSPISYYFTYYRNLDQESIETESVGSSSIGFDLNKPEEYRIPGMLF
jgi:hypothetical protein